MGLALLEFVVDVPIGHIAGRICPNATVEGEQRGLALLDGVGNHSRQVVLGQGALAALAADIKIRVEYPVSRSSLGGSQVKDGHRDR